MKIRDKRPAKRAGMRRKKMAKMPCRDFRLARRLAKP
jgi:hypothetical protein